MSITKTSRFVDYTNGNSVNSISLNASRGVRPCYLLEYKHTYSGTKRGGAERPAACDLVRGNKAVDLFPRIESQAAGRSAVCVFLPLRGGAVG